MVSNDVIKITNTQYDHWNKYITHPETSNSFVVPFFPHLEDVFCTLKLYRDTHSNKNIISDSVLMDAVFNDLGERYFAATRFIFVSELQKLKAGHHLAGENSHTRFLSFLKIIFQPDYLNKLYITYPVLKDLINNQQKLFLNFYKQLITHFSDDYETLKWQFLNADSVKLTKMIRAGDIHEQGRSVCIFEFYADEDKSCHRIVYKPKDLSTDKLYNQTLTWCANKLGINLKLPNYYYKNDYGWMQFIAQDEFENDAEVKDYFFKFGFVLAVTYLLLGKDFHAHNIIASKHGPILIDLECLLTPYMDGFSKIGHFLVLNTMLLPQKRLADENFSGFDISALSSVNNKYHVNEEYVVQDEGLDTMQWVKKKRLIPTANNLPLINGQEAQCFLYQDEIETGFSQCYQMLCQHKDWLISSEASPLAIANSIKPRVVLRNTNEYNKKIQEIYQPENMVSLNQHEVAIKNIFSHSQNPDLFTYETSMLKMGIIPTFWVSSHDKQIITGLGTTVLSIPNTSFDRLKEHIAHFNEQDLHRQIYLLRQSIFCYEYNQAEKYECRYMCKENLEQINQLFVLAFVEDKRIYWTTIQENFHQRFQIDKIEINMNDLHNTSLLFLTLLVIACNVELIMSNKKSKNA